MSKKTVNPKFSIKNLGFISEGEIEIKPLTILCGQNNTGKTWAMYGMYGCLERLPANPPLPKISEVAAGLSETGEVSLDMAQWVDEHYKKILELIHRGGKNRLARIFNVDKSIFENTSLDWQISKADMMQSIRANTFDFRLEVGKQVDALRILKPQGTTVAQFTLLAEKLPDVKRHVADAIFRFLLGQDDKRNIFLVPAERNGLHLFFRELSNRRSALLHHAGRDDFDLSKLINDVLGSRYAEPIADYIDWLNELRTYRKQKSDIFRGRADSIRKSLIGGKYDVNSEGDIAFTPGKKRGAPQAPKFPLHLASSTIKSMFGLWFYLEHQAKAGDILMIDEPELNLHPGAQRRIARILAAVVNQVINVVVSTHSDYFIREINSLIMLSRDTKVRDGLMKKHGYTKDELLSSDMVGAYMFEGGQIVPMDVTVDEGIGANTFDDVINDLNETSDSIYYAYAAELAPDEVVSAN